MATPPPNPPPRKPTHGPPLRRGRVKAQIFESLTGNISSAATRAGQFLAGFRGSDSSPDASANSSTAASASTSPPPSAYASDDQA